MNFAKEMHRVLSDAQREQFVHDGFVKLENAFPSETAAEARAILWSATGCDPTIARPGLVRSSGSETLHRNRFARQ